MNGNLLFGLGCWALLIVSGLRVPLALQREGLRQRECVTRFLAERDSLEKTL